MMKLSEAIRLGAMLRPQAYGAFFTGGGSCAWGAAFDAAGCDIRSNNFGAKTMAQLHAHGWDAISEIQIDKCPAGCTHTMCTAMRHFIAHLNDSPHFWTRERIADWVETIEKQHEAAQQPESKPEEIHAS